MGKPMITSDLLSIKEVIQDGINGILIPHGRPHKLANEILRLLKHEKLKIDLGRNARIKVLKYYTWKKQTSIFFRAIKSVLVKNRVNK